MSSGYQVEIAALKRVQAPMEESMVAAKRVVEKKDQLAAEATNAGNDEVRSAVEGFLEAWGYGCKQLARYADDISAKLDETIQAYQTCEELNIEGFTPTEDNLASLPTGGVSRWMFDHGGHTLPDSQEGGFEKTMNDWQTDVEDWMFG